LCGGFDTGDYVTIQWVDMAYVVTVVDDSYTKTVYIEAVTTSLRKLLTLVKKKRGFSG
jgi:hypothetical protein